MIGAGGWLLIALVELALFLVWQVSQLGLCMWSFLLFTGRV